MFLQASKNLCLQAIPNFYAYGFKQKARKSNYYFLCIRPIELALRLGSGLGLGLGWVKVRIRLGFGLGVELGLG